MTMASLILDDGCGLEYHGLLRHVLGKRSAGAGRSGGDLVHHVHALDHFSEYGVPLALRRCIGKIKRLGVRDVDEELRGRGMRIAGARHRHGTGHVEKTGLAALLGFVLNRAACRLLLEVRSKPAALNHESADHAVELRVVELLGLDASQKILDRLRRGVGVELDSDLAGTGLEVDLRIGGSSLSGPKSQTDGEAQQGTTEDGTLLLV